MTIVTRFDLFDRKADEDQGTDERRVLRLFEKRKLVGEFDLEDVTRYGEGDFDADDLKTWLTTGKDGKPLKIGRTVEQAMDYLGAEPGDEEGDEEREGGSIVPTKYRIIYGADQNCGDEIAKTLTAFVTQPRASRKDVDGGLDRAKLRGVAETNGIGDKLANWEERNLNGGLLRMNTSNVLRGMWRRGEEVVIGDQKWPAREVEKKARKSRAKKAK